MQHLCSALMACGCCAEADWRAVSVYGLVWRVAEQLAHMSSPGSRAQRACGDLSACFFYVCVGVCFEEGKLVYIPHVSI